MNRKVQIRKYIERDIDKVIVLFKDSVVSTCKNDYSKEAIDAWTQCFDEDRLDKIFLENYSIVATIDNEIVGFGDINIKNSYLNCLYVKPTYQRQGIATLICDELEKQVDSRIDVHASITALNFFLKRHYDLINKQEVVRNGVKLTNYVLKKDYKLTDW